MKGLEAGKELDTLISKEIMFTISHGISWSYSTTPYSTDMSAAWTVLEMRSYERTE